jgi:hypothetical protein
MTKRGKQNGQKSERPAPPEPIDMADGIPDASSRRPAWKYAVLIAIFLAWAAFLLYCGLAGGL